MAESIWTRDNGIEAGIMCMHGNGPGCLQCAIESQGNPGKPDTWNDKPARQICTCHATYRDPFCKACGKLPDPNPDAACGCKGKKGWHAISCPHHPSYGQPDIWSR